MKILTILISLLLLTPLAFAGELMEKQSLRHGVSELGNLQVYPITEIIEDDKVISSTRGNPYTPKDVNNMEGFDQKSKDIVSAITTKEVKDAFKLEEQEKTNIGIEKIITYDRIAQENGAIAVRKITRIFDNGKEISKKYHRSWINPGDNTDGKDVMSKEVAKKLHTQEVIDSYKIKLEEQQI